MDRASIREEILKGMNKLRGLPEEKDGENSQKNNKLKASPLMLQPKIGRTSIKDPVIKSST